MSETDINLSEQGEQDWLFPYSPSRKPELIPPIALAYIGDAVYEVAVRQYLLSKPNLRPHHLHQKATSFVSAKGQSRILSLIESKLDDKEMDVVRQGRNAKSSVPKNADVQQYRHATAFECLVGYLYLSKREARLRELIDLGITQMQQENNN
ncbi:MULTISPECIES: ribonuclease III domain-containing protein [unclassified Paenibacillus]|uniref:Mini-ribonuclease 3 n=1 Tax=Paenibacillus provencensis TaxID=441151 RepID=A0ABW3QI25_9BACL|nr:MULTISPECIES: ribonuclease III domain-containing protein [unclassified Paenibacillus]MCM3130814.1 ribonuclease III [Paenibacillus sp. MER 78]SFS95543.1 ribonuclease-3 family protein [Paenibacillus sp. 453mf]